VSIGTQRVEYDLGHRKITEKSILLHHDDVLALAETLLPVEKFQSVLAGKFPFILIDEYQDTNLKIMDSLKTHVLGRQGMPLVGLFGDHWQRIYDKTCGHVAHNVLTEIGKKANFRSSTSVVSMLNNMRPDLPQAVKDEAFVGSAAVYHTNSWVGTRLTGGHWGGDLPKAIAHQYLEAFIPKLEADGWDLSPERTKILILTHKVLASEQGYETLEQIFPYNDLFIKKEDPYISFFVDTLEPACDAYKRRRYGEMFTFLGDAAPSISSHDEKVQWSTVMDKLILLRETGSIGQVVDHIRETNRLDLPEAVMRREEETRAWQGEAGEEPPENIGLIRQLREVPYQEIIALEQFISGHTPFATKHSVKGDEFENVLVVLGRGWNLYNFNQFLELAATPDNIPANKQDFFERNRNLFYVSCSRPTTRLALLFTQQLSNAALQTLHTWFGVDAVSSFNPSLS
jgi:DNA helicase II / ATP-dependent DNA helicase PcrA